MKVFQINRINFFQILLNLILKEQNKLKEKLKKNKNALNLLEFLLFLSILIIYSLEKFL